ncbi:MAG: hypothetical protein WBG71_13745 [Leeuwenhoekiella sp.]
MKNFKFKNIIFTACLVFFVSIAASAQIDIPDGDPDVDDSPIGGFVALGVAAAALLGANKLRRTDQE